jgi:hypothetical protein
MHISVLIEKHCNRNRLQYVLDTFMQVTNAEFSFEIVEEESRIHDDSLIVICYGNVAYTLEKNAVKIPCENRYETDHYTYISINDKLIQDERLVNEHLPIFRATISSLDLSSSDGTVIIRNETDKVLGVFSYTIPAEVKLGFDLFFNIFVHLSCLEEYEFEKQGGPRHSHASRLKKDERIYKKPIVNYLFALLEDFIPLLSDEVHKNKLFGKQEGFHVLLSHDVDYLHKTVQLRARRLAFYFIKALKNFKNVDFQNGFKNMHAGLVFLLTLDNYWQFEYIQELEDAYEFRSVFFIYAKTKIGWRDWLKRQIFDPTYDVKTNRKLQLKLMDLIDRGWEVGLHGSFNSFNSKDILQPEKKSLDLITNTPVSSTRQHWLRLSIENTWHEQYEAGIKFDTTLGFNDVIGFRAGIANSYHPYDFIGEKEHKIVEIPMVIMDGTLFDYKGEASISEVIDILKEVKKFNGCVSINWHQRTAANDYGWYNVYEGILNWLKENNGKACLW